MHRATKRERGGCGQNASLGQGRWLQGGLHRAPAAGRAANQKPRRGGLLVGILRGVPDSHPGPRVTASC